MRRTTLKKAAAAFFTAGLLLFYLFLLFEFFRSTPFYRMYTSGAGAHVDYEKASVVSVNAESVGIDPNGSGLTVGYQELTVRILTGERKGQTAQVRNSLNYLTNVPVKAGGKLIVCIDTADKNTFSVSVYSADRAPFLFGMVAVFIVALGVIGGKRGVKSVVGILFTLSNILLLFIPMLYRGWSPAAAAVAVAVLTAVVTLLLIGGFGVKTLCAILGTAAGALLAGVILLIAQRFTGLSGYNTDEADSLLVLAGNTHMKIGELLFAAILIASLGAVMDIAISIASAVNEVYVGNTGLSGKDLFFAGMNVGRDMMGTMANTLILAFTGTSLNALILLYSYHVSYYQLINMNMLAIEIVQTLSGSLAVVLTVPLVSLFAARLIPLFRPRAAAAVKTAGGETVNA